MMRQRRPRIIVVEADRSVRRLLGQILKSNGYASALLGSFNKLPGALAGQNTSTVICDLSIPESLRQCAGLRQDYPLLRFVMMAADNLQAQTAVRVGFEHVLIKPFTNEQLISELRKALKI